jgi:hypothetical protein
MAIVFLPERDNPRLLFHHAVTKNIGLQFALYTCCHKFYTEREVMNMPYRILEVPKNTAEIISLIDDLEFQSHELSNKIKEFTIKKGIIEQIRLELLDNIHQQNAGRQKAVGLQRTQELYKKKLSHLHAKF